MASVHHPKWGAGGGRAALNLPVNYIVNMSSYVHD